MNSLCKYNFLSIIILVNSIYIYAMELPEYEKKLKHKIKKTLEIGTKICSKCKKEVDISGDKGKNLHATSCCKNFICESCIREQIESPIIETTQRTSISKFTKFFDSTPSQPCPLCAKKFKIAKAIFKLPGHPLFDAITNNKQKIVQEILDKPLINLEVFDPEGYTPLVLATIAGNRAIVAKLMERRIVEGKKCGALLATEVHDYTALHWAASLGHNTIITYFLSHCYVDVDLRNHKNETPLMCACYNAKIDTIRHLLAYQANPEITNNNNENAIDIAGKNDDNDLRDKMLALLNKKK
jgi:ankyrin repeat protein